jgi:hypothetical protein
MAPQTVAAADATKLPTKSPEPASLECQAVPDVGQDFDTTARPESIANQDLADLPHDSVPTKKAKGMAPGAGVPRAKRPAAKPGPPPSARVPEEGSERTGEPDAEMAPAAEKTKKVAKKAEKKVEKQPPKPLIMSADASVAQQLLREAPMKYEDLNDLLGIQPKTKVKLPHKGGESIAPSVKATVTKVPDAEAGHADVLPVESSVEDGKRDGGMKKTYGGKLEKGKFVKAPMELGQMSEADKQACLADIEETKKTNYAAAEVKKKQHEAKLKAQKSKTQAAYDTQMKEARSLDEERSQKRIEELQKWLQMKESESKSKKEREERMMTEIRDKEREKAEALAKLKEKGEEERDRRLKVAQKQKQKLETQLQAMKLAKSQAADAGMPTAPSYPQPDMMGQQMAYPSACQALPPAMVGPADVAQGFLMPGLPGEPSRVLHRHIHHHVHYHDAEADVHGHSPSHQQQSAAAMMTPEELHQFELASEARVRGQLEAQGVGEVDSFAETPNMRKARSMGALLPGGELSRTQEAFQHRVPSLPQLGPGGNRGLPRGPSGLDKAMGAYADPMRPRFVKPKAQATVKKVAGKGLGPLPGSSGTPQVAGGPRQRY